MTPRRLPDEVRAALGWAQLCEDCGEEAGNHSADCPTWGDHDRDDEPNEWEEM